MKIVRAQPYHIPRMVELEKQCFSMPWSGIMIMSELTNMIGYYIAAEIHGELVGYAGMQVIVDEGYVTNVAVDPLHRRMGIAEALMTALYERGKERELLFLSLEVRESNLAAQALYKKMGFETAGKRRGYYEKPKEDALIMTYNYTLEQ